MPSIARQRFQRQRIRRHVAGQFPHFHGQQAAADDEQVAAEARYMAEQSVCHGPDRRPHEAAGQRIGDDHQIGNRLEGIRIAEPVAEGGRGADHGEAGDGGAQAFPVVPGGVAQFGRHRMIAGAQAQARVAEAYDAVAAHGHLRLPLSPVDHAILAAQVAQQQAVCAVVFDNGVLGRRMWVVEDEVVAVAAPDADRQGLDPLAPLHFAILGEDFKVIGRLHGLRLLLVEGARDSASRKVRVTRMPLA
ncbi:hypothetical protein D3C81_1498050 [compost metagenome]